MDMMDPSGYCTDRLFREHCTYMNNVFVKDLSLVGRPLKDSIIIDNSPTSYMLQPECALPILSWYDEPRDNALLDLIPLLIQLSMVDDVRDAIPKFVRNHNNTVDFNVAYSVCQQLLGAKAKRVGGSNANETSQGDMVIGQQLTQNNS